MQRAQLHMRPTAATSPRPGTTEGISKALVASNQVSNNGQLFKQVKRRETVVRLRPESGWRAASRENKLGYIVRARKHCAAMSELSSRALYADFVEGAG